MGFALTACGNKHKCGLAVRGSLGGSLRLAAARLSMVGRDRDRRERTGTLLHCGTLLAFSGCTSSSSSAKAAGAARRLPRSARARLPARDGACPCLKSSRNLSRRVRLRDGRGRSVPALRVLEPERHRQHDRFGRVDGEARCKISEGVNARTSRHKSGFRYSDHLRRHQPRAGKHAAQRNQ